MVGTYPGDPLCSNEELNRRLLRAIDMRAELQQDGTWQILLSAQIKEFRLRSPLYTLLLETADSTIRRMSSTGLGSVEDCETNPFSERRKTDVIGGPGFLWRLLAAYGERSHEITLEFNNHEILLLRKWQSEVIQGPDN
jgi:hypothetical protein